MSRLPHILAWLSLAGLVAPCGTHAAEWTAKPSLTLRSGYNDNIRLTTAPHDSVWEYDVTPSLAFGAATERTSLTGDASASVRRFSGGSGTNSSSLLDREDYHFNTLGSHRTELDEVVGRVNFTRDSTLDSELDETGQVVRDRATRDRLLIGPTWTRVLNEKTSLTTGYQISKIEYSDKVGASNLVDYDYHNFSASLTRVLTPRLQGTLASSYNLYQPTTGLDSKTINLQAGITRSFSETLTTSWLAGIRETTSDAVNQTGFCIGADPNATFPLCNNGIPIVTGTRTDENKTNGAVYSASITKLLETGRLSASISRSTNPSSDGELLDTTRLVISAERNFTEKIRTALQIAYFDKEVIVNRTGNDPDQNNTTLLTVKPRILWRWDREWELAAEYEYAKDKDRNSESATRNAAYLTLRYRPDKFSISR